MGRLVDKFWVGVATVLSLVVAVVGYPAFHRRLSFPLLHLWTLAAVGGVWHTYLIRASAFGSGDHGAGGAGKEDPR